MLKPHVLPYSIKIFHSTMHLENRISLKYAAFANIDIFHHMMPDKSPLISLESLSSTGKQSGPYAYSKSCCDRRRISKTLSFILKTWFSSLGKKFCQLFLEVTHFVAPWGNTCKCPSLGNCNLCQSLFQVKMTVYENQAVDQLVTQIIVHGLFL